MKRVKQILIPIMISVILTGCYPSGKTNSAPAPESAETSLPEPESLRLTAELPAESPDSIPIIKVKFASFDKDKATEVFFKDTTFECVEDNVIPDRYMYET